MKENHVLLVRAYVRHVSSAVSKQITTLCENNIYYQDEQICVQWFFFFIGSTNPPIPGSSNPSGASSTSQPTVTSHYAHSLLVVDACGLVRHHQLIPGTSLSNLNFSEQEISSFMEKLRTSGSRTATICPDPLKSTPTGISPALLEMESLRLTSARYFFG